MIDEDERICRVCREGDFDGRLFGPCKCKGSIRWVHQTCLLSWIAHSKSLKCEMCFHPFKLTKVYHRRSPPKLSLTLVFQHQRQICSLWLKRIFRFLVWASLSLFLGPLLVGIALRIYITPVIQWPIAYPHFCRGLIRKWVFGFCVILFCNLFQASWHVWRRWYQVAVASWVQPLSESESTEPSRQPSQSSFSDFHPSDLSQDSEVAELNIGSTDAIEAPAPFDTPPRSEAQISTHHLPSDPNFLIDDDQLVEEAPQNDFVDSAPLSTTTLRPLLGLLIHKQKKRAMCASVLRDFLALNRTCATLQQQQRTRAPSAEPHSETFDSDVRGQLNSMPESPLSHIDRNRLAAEEGEMFNLAEFVGANFSFRMMLVRAKADAISTCLWLYVGVALPLHFSSFIHTPCTHELPLITFSCLITITKTLLLFYLLAFALVIAALRFNSDVLAAYWLCWEVKLLAKPTKFRTNVALCLIFLANLAHCATEQGQQAWPVLGRVARWRLWKRLLDLWLLLLLTMTLPVDWEPLEGQLRMKLGREEENGTILFILHMLTAICLHLVLSGLNFLFPPSTTILCDAQGHSCTEIMYLGPNQSLSYQMYRRLLGITDAEEDPQVKQAFENATTPQQLHRLEEMLNHYLLQVPTSVLPAGSSWVNLSDQHPPSPPSPIRPTTPDAPLPQLTPEPQIAPESSASNPASLLSASLTSFFRFFAEICCVTTVLPCLIGLVMCWVLAPFFQTGEHFDVDIVEQQRSIGCLITWATAWFNTGFALPPFLHMMWYWGCGVLYLSLVLTFQYAVLKPIINPGVDLWFMHFRPGPEEEETWDSLLREIVREPFWRSFLAYAKGLLRDVVVIICLIRTPLKLTRKIVADHLFPIPLFPQDSQQQYSPSLHFCQAFVAFILLFAIVQSFNIRLFLTSTCFKFLSGISTPLRMDTYLLCPDGLLESDTDTEEDTPPESPLSDTDLEEPPQSCFMLKKCALVMLIWGASIISLTMLVAIPLAFADLAVNYPFDARVSKINPICCLIALLVLTGSFRAVTVAHWVGRLLYFLGTIFCFGCLCSTFLVRLPLRACYHLARHSLHMLCNPIQGWRGSRRRWCQSVYDQLYLEGLRLHNLESVP
eukprot:NODE_68_length_3516_cov_40.223960_g63_i0.p1 GENE.NODE_68_length_3516_cov_40.223960_g63_i0~~NODE_68_length_3516_cov_40.223960_g63_i0.p1  ORF type:complete len:1113 (+),score=208.57 NODE_68_length_3516_cov_40.223960_g63_i0:81-3419(+)